MTVALENEIAECQTLLASGKIPMRGRTSTIYRRSSVGNACVADGRNGLDNNARDIASFAAVVRPFLDAFEAEVARVAEGVLAAERSIERSARALLMSADATARSAAVGAAAGGGAGAAAPSPYVDGDALCDLRQRASDLSDRVLRLNCETVRLPLLAQKCVYGVSYEALYSWLVSAIASIKHCQYELLSCDLHTLI